MESPHANRVASSELELCELRESGLLGDGVDLRPRLIDLFSGAGGMSAGFTTFENHIFVPVWANDFDEAAAGSYEANFGHTVRGDIVTLLENPAVDIPQADVVIGGPPCQGFSLLNREKDGDPRRHLWQPFLEVVERCGARVWAMENVPQLLGTPEHHAILDRAKAQGFTTTSAVLCAADYGVPQTRYRAVMVGARDLDPSRFFPPVRTHRPADDAARPRLFSDDAARHVGEPEPWRTVRDAISGLDEPVGTEPRDVPPPYNLHFGRRPTETSLRRYRLIPEGGNRLDLERQAPELTPACWRRRKGGGTDVFGRLWWDRPALTVRTEFFKPEKGRYLHPTQDRPITHREAARLQAFPDHFVLKGSKTEIARQIGNAVPPPMAARVADSLLSMLLARD